MNHTKHINHIPYINLIVYLLEEPVQDNNEASPLQHVSGHSLKG